MDSKKILILGNANSPFVIHFTNWILKKRPHYTIDILNTNDQVPEGNSSYVTKQLFPKNHFKTPSKLTSLRSLYYFRKKMASFKNKEYDIIMLHYVNPWYAVFSKLLKSKTKQLIPVFWGSDLNKISDSKKERLKKLCKKSDKIIVGSPFLLQEISKEIPKYKEKYKMCYFGCEPIESIKHFIDVNKTNFKDNFDIDTDKITIALGYNGAKAQQHLKIIENIKNSDALLLHKNNIHFIFSLTYGLTDLYKNEILNALKDFSYSYTILTSFMNEEESAKLRLATDIFVNLQDTDSFNGTLRESFYANSIVINGSWLPYATLKEYGLYFNEIPSIDSLDKKLVDCIINFEKEKEKHKVNQGVIYNIASWSKTIDCWLKVMENH